MSDPVIRQAPSGRELVCFDRGDEQLLLSVEDLLVVREHRDVVEAALAADGRALAALGEDEAQRAQALRDAFAARSSKPTRAPDRLDPIGQVNVCNTLRCNLRCRYCYNEIETKEKKGSAARTVMSAEIGHQLIEALLAQERIPRELALLFIGGESLIDRAGMDALIRHGRRRCARRRVGLAPVIYTNGVLLDRDLVAWADKLDVSLVVSLDGPPAINDRFRVFPSGAPSTAATLRGVEQLVRHGRQRVRRVRSVTTEPTALLPLHQYLLDLGFNDLYVQAAYDQRGYHDHDEALDLEALADWYRTLLLAGVVISIHPFEVLLERLRARGRGVPNHYPCGAALQTLAIGPDGTWYPCHHFIGERDWALGNVRDGLPAADQRHRACVPVAARTPCDTCWARHLCGGECYHRALTAGRGYDGVIEESCERKRRFFELGVELLTDVKARRPDALAALLERRLTPLPFNPVAYEQDDLRIYHHRT